MSILDTWIDDAEKTLGLTPGSLPKDLRDDLLGVTRDVAHGVARVAAPLTCYLAGLAVARGDDPATVVAALRDLVPAQAPPDKDAQDIQNEPSPPVTDQHAVPAPDSGPAEQSGPGRS